MGTDGDVDFHARRHVITHHFGHLTNGLAVTGRLLNQFKRDDLAMLRLSLVLGWHQNILTETLVVRHDKRHPALDKQPANNGLVGPFQDLDDGTFTPATSIDAANTGHGAITV